MTVQQEAIRMINSLPDDTVGILVEFLKRMTDNESHFKDRRVVGDLRIHKSRRKLGIADGMYNIPDSIDTCNDEIARMFGVSE
ncbi:MAG: hypothetical protein IJH64_02945 [Oscillospiraceae bacterium]|nr:hypothetical protein [Oscillospiraceae bacterium]